MWTLCWLLAGCFARTCLLLNIGEAQSLSLQPAAHRLGDSRCSAPRVKTVAALAMLVCKPGSASLPGARVGAEGLLQKGHALGEQARG